MAPSILMAAAHRAATAYQNPAVGINTTTALPIAIISIALTTTLRHHAAIIMMMSRTQVCDLCVLMTAAASIFLWLANHRRLLAD
jgi:hypothetical protein